MEPDPYRRILCFLIPALLPLAAIGQSVADQELWRIGIPDNGSSEFKGAFPPASLTLSSTQAARSEWPELPARWNAGPTQTELQYVLPSVPAYGVHFSIKILQAGSYGSELAVFSNGNPCGIIQAIGTGGPGTTTGRAFRKTYTLYIPKEFLAAGANTLGIRALGHTYNRNSNSELKFEWDFMRLSALAGPATEPLHGKMTHMALQAAYEDFGVYDSQVKNEPHLHKWMGTAYSGNTMRAAFWRNVGHNQPKRLEYLEAMRDINMSVIADFYSAGKVGNPDPDAILDANVANGDLPQRAKTLIDDFFARYGKLIQYYELSNEPCMGISDESFEGLKALAKYVNTAKPDHVQVAAPGWAFGGGYGSPKDWDADPVKRRAIEASTQMINGHAYGDSNRWKGGNLIDNLDTYGPVVDEGWPREFINTEAGTHDVSHFDWSSLGYNQLHAGSFDHSMREHIGFADRFIAFSAWGYDGFKWLDGDRDNPETWKARPFPQTALNQESRVKIFRRLALAYATHGRPLPYRYANPDLVKDKLVYFRAVNTATLAPLRGSGARSDKLLLNFVNFESSSQTLHVKVTLPAAGSYDGEMYGPGETYAASHRVVTGLMASPELELKVDLGPGESAQYILTGKGFSGIRPRPGEAKAKWLKGLQSRVHPGILFPDPGNGALHTLDGRNKGGIKQAELK